jgi:hypothetical protein
MVACFFIFMQEKFFVPSLSLLCPMRKKLEMGATGADTWGDFGELLLSLDFWAISEPISRDFSS